MYEKGPNGSFKTTVRATFTPGGAPFTQEMECTFSSTEDVTGSFSLRFKGAKSSKA